MSRGSGRPLAYATGATVGVAVTRVWPEYSGTVLASLLVVVLLLLALRVLR
jgi:tetrahydromethanopterin S-methyltransferase subunit F